MTPLTCVPRARGRLHTFGRWMAACRSGRHVRSHHGARGVREWIGLDPHLVAWWADPVPSILAVCVYARNATYTRMSRGVLTLTINRSWLHTRETA